ncbi:ArsR/SmtB family transcription factor [Bacillus pseudomycoides]|uniref:ArsR/SmtB family transcription factor n=1 Tax=Bacillus pseudomycoides TaxID=64104 RepID=UPI002FFDA29C
MTIKQLNSDEKRVKIFKALAEIKRIEILRYLYRDKNIHTCGDIEKSIGVNKSNHSYHLKILLEADLIDVKRHGQYKIITIKENIFHEFLPGFLATL